MLSHFYTRYLPAIEWKPVLEMLGRLLTMLAAVMLLPCLADIVTGSDDWQAFCTGSFFTAFIGVSLILCNRGHLETITTRQTFLLATLIWLVLPAFAAIPFAMSDDDMGYTNAFFEAMSGMTSCGATIFTKLSEAPAGILLWRALLNWMGGIGVIVIAIAILPMLKIGGLQLFKTEMADKSDTIFLRARQLAGAMGVLYLSMTAVSAIMLWMAGMSGFDALCHAMAAIASGGFSNYDDSIAHFNNVWIEVVMMVTMLASCLPFALYLQVGQGRWLALWRDSQVRVFFAVLALSITAVTLWLVVRQHIGVLSSLRMASFNVTSVLTTSGFYSSNYSNWGSFPLALMFILSLVGGCTGSAAGAIKIFRLQILYETVKAHINHIIHPHGIFRPQFNRKPVSEGVVSSVLVFFFVYIAFLLIFSLLVAITGVDFVTSFSGVASAMAASGYGVGDVIHPGGTYAPLPSAAKWILSAAMMMGRLEFITVLVLFSPAFWRD